MKFTLLLSIFVFLLISGVLQGETFLDSQIYKFVPQKKKVIFLYPKEGSILFYIYDDLNDFIKTYYNPVNVLNLKHNNNYMENPSYLFRFDRTTTYIFSEGTISFLLKKKLLNISTFRVKLNLKLINQNYFKNENQNYENNTKMPETFFSHLIELSVEIAHFSLTLSQNLESLNISLFL
jgi:hypothetical protein